MLIFRHIVGRVHSGWLEDVVADVIAVGLAANHFNIAAKKNKPVVAVVPVRAWLELDPSLPEKRHLVLKFF